MEARIGRQTPTTSMVLPYRKTVGDEAVKLLNLPEKHALTCSSLAVLYRSEPISFIEMKVVPGLCTDDYTGYDAG